MISHYSQLFMISVLSVVGCMLLVFLPTRSIVIESYRPSLELPSAMHPLHVYYTRGTTEVSLVRNESWIATGQDRNLKDFEEYLSTHASSVLNQGVPPDS